VMEIDDLPQDSRDAASKLSSEDLAPYSQDELEERILLLKAEILRVESHYENAARQRNAADALFRKPER